MCNIKVQYIDGDDYVIIKLLNISKSIIDSIEDGIKCFDSELFGEICFQCTHHVYFLTTDDKSGSFLALGSVECNNRFLLIEKESYTYDNIVTSFNDIFQHISTETRLRPQEPA